jgi:DNA-binding transcriptional regulator YdaS (Cro superfamily)
MSPLQRAILQAGGPAKVANLIGRSTQAVCFYRDGDRSFPPEHGATLETASGVKRWEIWPENWHLIWPELIGTKGAPAIPETTKPA